MNQSLDTRSLFLKEFIKRIIIKSKVQPKIEKKEVLLEKLEEVVLSPPKLEIKPEIKAKEVIKQPVQVQSKPIIQKVQIKPAMPQLPQISKMTIMDRINRIFSDPGVQVLNCPGPDKNISITKFGLMLKTQISFTESDIKDFMKDLSEKTRIPLISGLIKLVYQNLMITAVVSEFVGTKFIVERTLHSQLKAPARAQFR